MGASPLLVTRPVTVVVGHSADATLPSSRKSFGSMNIVHRPFRLGVRSILVACAALVAAPGCERDETVRGAGSIEVPAENLKFQPTVKGKAKSKAARHG